MAEAVHSFPLADNWRYLLLTVLFGVSVGATEIVARYKDEPWRAVLRTPGLIYCALNGSVSAVAFFLLVYYKGEVFTNLGSDKLLTSIVAGFGAMVILRSKLFTFQTEAGETYAVGPEAVLSTILSTIDREIDRKQSARRQALMKELPEIADSGRANQAIEFIRTSLGSYQNLSAAEKTVFGQIISDVQEQSQLSPALQLTAISFGLMKITGEENYKALMSALKEFLKAQAPASAPARGPAPTVPPPAPGPAGAGQPPPNP